MSFADDLMDIQITPEERANQKQKEIREKWEKALSYFLTKCREAAQRGEYYLCQDWDDLDKDVWDAYYQYFLSELNKEKYGFHSVDVSKYDSINYGNCLRVTVSWSAEGRQAARKEVKKWEKVLHPYRGCLISVLSFIAIVLIVIAASVS